MSIRKIQKLDQAADYLLSTLRVDGHHLSQSFQHFDAQLLLLLLQKLLSMFNQPEGMSFDKSSERISADCML
jgi:hypothetical protein